MSTNLCDKKNWKIADKCPNNPISGLKACSVHNHGFLRFESDRHFQLSNIVKTTAKFCWHLYCEPVLKCLKNRIVFFQCNGNGEGEEWLSQVPKRVFIRDYFLVVYFYWLFPHFHYGSGKTRISPKTGTESKIYFLILFPANEAVDSVSLVQLGAVSPCPCMY